MYARKSKREVAGRSFMGSAGMVGRGAVAVAAKSDTGTRGTQQF